MICVPIKKTTITNVQKTLKEAQKIADVIEIWFDEIKNLSEDMVVEIFKSSKKPILYKWQGNIENLEIVLNHRPHFIDLDLENPKKIIRRVKKLSPKTKIIISSHNFKKTPKKADLLKLTKQMVKKGADIVKIATFATRFSDSLEMLSLLQDLCKKGQPAICICMGREGELTRTTGHLFGNYLMYGPIKKQDITAAGQIEATELQKIQNLIN